MINSIIDSMIWLGFLLPLAFLHGHFVGKKHGIEVGAGRMFEKIWSMGTPTDTKGVRTIELSNE